MNLEVRVTGKVAEEATPLLVVFAMDAAPSAGSVDASSAPETQPLLLNQEVAALTGAASQVLRTGEFKAGLHETLLPMHI